MRSIFRTATEFFPLHCLLFTVCAAWTFSLNIQDMVGQWEIRYPSKVRFEELGTTPEAYTESFMIKFISKDIAELSFPGGKIILLWTLMSNGNDDFITIHLISKDEGNSILYLKPLTPEHYFLIAKNEGEEDLLFIGSMEKR